VLGTDRDLVPVRFAIAELGVELVSDIRVQLAVVIGPEMKPDRDRDEGGGQPRGHDEGRNRTGEEPEHARIVADAPHPVKRGNQDRTEISTLFLGAV